MLLPFTGNLIPTSPFDRECAQLADRHYSRQTIGSNQFAGNGSKLVLRDTAGAVLFVWLLSLFRLDDEAGLNCPIFRNESRRRSSEIILEAETWALQRWGPMRLFTYVDPRKVQSANPGYCFKMAGWRYVRTSRKGLHLLEKLPESVSLLCSAARAMPKSTSKAARGARAPRSARRRPVNGTDPAQSHKPAAVPPNPPTKKLLPHEEAGLCLADFVFCQEYLLNGFKAGPAYRKGHPNAADNTCWTEGWQTLRKPKVRDYLEPRITEHWQARHLSGDEVLARVGMDATADIRTVYDKDGKMLPIQQWPDEIVNSIEGIEEKPDGTKKIKLASKTLARRTILEITGKVKKDGGIDELAAALRETLAKNTADATNPGSQKG